MITIFMSEQSFQHQDTATRHMLRQCANTIVERDERENLRFDTAHQFEMGPDEFHKLRQLVKEVGS